MKESKGFVLFVSSVLNLPFVCRHSNTKEDHQKSIFVQCEKGGYRLKDNVQFHLYISTSPCGDARIFSPHEAGVEGTEQPLAVSPPASSLPLQHVFNLVST